MSLLLDALKKAADDKQKASQGDSVKDEKAESTGVDTLQPLAGEAAGPDADDSKVQPETVGSNEEELTLDLDDSYLNKNDSPDPVNESYVAAPESANQPPESGHETNAEQKNQGRRNAEPAQSFTVSDEALSMLISKTNHDVKKNKRLVAISILITALLVVIAGGLYYYQETQEEIAMLERKHSIAMQSMKAKTRTDEGGQNREIVRKLVAEGDIDDKVKYAKKHIAKKRQVKQQRQAATVTNKPAAVNTGNALSIRKTNKTDPVGDKLEDAWLAYESGNYGKAKTLYREVLSLEDKNRDAMLGLGAIAVVEKDSVRARNIYLALLELDPRDPIASAALASLHSDESSLQSSENYLLSMLQKNPGAAHLNFALGNVYAQQNKWSAAQQAYFKAWQSDSENADYIFNLAVSMDQLGKNKQAVDLYKDSLLKSENKQVSFSRADVTKRIQDLSGM